MFLFTLSAGGLSYLAKTGCRGISKGGVSVEIKQSLQARQELKLTLRLEQADLLEMPEEEFHRLVVEVERSSLFQKLYLQAKIIRFQKFPQADISPHFYEVKEELLADRSPADVESLLVGKEDIVRLIQKLGLEKFKRYFLFPEPELEMEEVAQECGLTVSEIHRINRLVDEMAIMSEFSPPSATGSGGGIHYSKIASVERSPEGFVLGYFSPLYARGRYLIDYEKFAGLKSKGIVPGSELKEAAQLFKKLELINSRKDTIYRILRALVEKQTLYLESGETKALLPFTQKELAERLGLAPSSVSRAIQGKSIDTPWGKERPLRDFFPRPRRYKKELLRLLLEGEKEPLPDEKIRARLKEKFGISVSRRLVANLRKELKIPSSWRRKRTSAGAKQRS